MRRVNAAVRTSVRTGATNERHEAGLAVFRYENYLRRRHWARARRSSTEPLFLACRKRLVPGKGAKQRRWPPPRRRSIRCSSSSLKLVVPTQSERRARDGACQDEHSPLFERHRHASNTSSIRHPAQPVPLERVISSPELHPRVEATPIDR